MNKLSAQESHKWPYILSWIGYAIMLSCMILSLLSSLGLDSFFYQLNPHEDTYGLILFAILSLGVLCSGISLIATYYFSKIQLANDQSAKINIISTATLLAPLILLLSQPIYGVIVSVSSSIRQTTQTFPIILATIEVLILLFIPFLGLIIHSRTKPKQQHATASPHTFSTLPQYPSKFTYRFTFFLIIVSVLEFLLLAYCTASLIYELVKPSEIVQPQVQIDESCLKNPERCKTTVIQ